MNCQLTQIFILQKSENYKVCLWEQSRLLEKKTMNIDEEYLFLLFFLNIKVSRVRQRRGVNVADTFIIIFLM